MRFTWYLVQSCLLYSCQAQIIWMAIHRMSTIRKGKTELLKNISSCQTKVCSVFHIQTASIWLRFHYHIKMQYQQILKCMWLILNRRFLLWRCWSDLLSSTQSVCFMISCVHLPRSVLACVALSPVLTCES